MSSVSCEEEDEKKTYYVISDYTAVEETQVVNKRVSCSLVRLCCVRFGEYIATSVAALSWPYVNTVKRYVTYG